MRRFAKPFWGLKPPTGVRIPPSPPESHSKTPLSAVGALDGQQAWSFAAWSLGLSRSALHHPPSGWWQRARVVRQLVSFLPRSSSLGTKSCTILTFNKGNPWGSKDAGSIRFAIQIRLQESLVLLHFCFRDRRARRRLDFFLTLAGKPGHRKSRQRRANPEATGAGSHHPGTTGRQRTCHSELLRHSRRHSSRGDRSVVLRRCQRQNHQARAAVQSRLAFLLSLCRCNSH